MNNIFYILVLSLFLVACGTDEELAIEVEPNEAVVEAAVTMISGMADEESGSLSAMYKKPESSIWNYILPKAYADDCVRAYNQVCSSGVREAVYDSCSLSSSQYQIDGGVQLTYSENNCSMATVGNTVTRTYNIEINGPRGGQLSHNSADNFDYKGYNYGGGGRITTTGSGWTMEILGRHSKLTFKDIEIFDVSTRTLSPVSVTGSLARTSRVVDGGQIEVNHNNAEFTAVVTTSNLQWSSSCCHPTSGQLDISYSGTREGNAEVNFTGECGEATIDYNGQSSSMMMSYCE